jgi:hypothetical protein
MNHPILPPILIHPEDSSDVRYWAKKWGVSARQIFDAIIDTGSLDPKQIRQVLRERNQLNNVFYRLLKKAKTILIRPGRDSYQGPVLRVVR